jgi:hypothetical protein
MCELGARLKAALGDHPLSKRLPEPNARREPARVFAFASNAQLHLGVVRQNVAISKVVGFIAC